MMEQQTNEQTPIGTASALTAGLECCELRSEELARLDCGGDDIDWADPSKLGATARQRAAFRRGYKAGCWDAGDAATLAEREACAKTVENAVDSSCDSCKERFADAIRKRSNV
jgi:hypothetical protein